PDALGRGRRPMMGEVALAHLDDRPSAARGAVAPDAVRRRGPGGRRYDVRGAAVDARPLVARAPALRDVDDVVEAPVMDQDRYGPRRLAAYGREAAADRRDRRDAIGHRAPDELAQVGAVREAGRVHARAVDAVVGLEPIEKARDEPEVAVARRRAHFPADALEDPARGLEPDGQPLGVRGHEGLAAREGAKARDAPHAGRAVAEPVEV